MRQVDTQQYWMEAQMGKSGRHVLICFDDVTSSSFSQIYLNVEGDGDSHGKQDLAHRFVQILLHYYIIYNLYDMVTHGFEEEGYPLCRTSFPAAGLFSFARIIRLGQGPMKCNATICY